MPYPNQRKNPPRPPKRRGRGGIAAVLVLCVLLAVVLLFPYVKEALPFDFGSETESATATKTESATSTATETQSRPQDGAAVTVYFPELGNAQTGDCTYIKAGDTDILIDAGSRTNSVDDICAFLNQYVSDGVLEYVIVTHAHRDHYACFAGDSSHESLFDLYTCETVIDFACVTEDGAETVMYQNYQKQLGEAVAAGTKHMTARECIEQNESVFSVADGVTLTVLDSEYYYTVSSDENNHSVCCLLTDADGRNYLFTGDLEKEGEAALLTRNTLPHVDLLKAGHHGSPTSSTEAFLAAVTPDAVCVCCCCGSPEYTKTDANQFPSQAFIDRIAPYTDRVYATTLYDEAVDGKFTSMNGTLTVSQASGGVTVTGSATSDPLYLSAWFRAHRTLPAAWQK